MISRAYQTRIMNRYLGQKIVLLGAANSHRFEF